MKFVNSPKVEYQPDGLPNSRESKRPLFIRMGAIVTLILAIGFNIYVLTRADVPNLVKNNNSAVESVVVDAQNLPIPNALVFPANDPNNSTVTDENGRFLLNNMPSGINHLVVVRNNVGQEFFVTLEEDKTTQLNTLNFIAPLVDIE